MNRKDVMALVALASSAYPAMQDRDPRPIVAAWSLMLGDIDPVIGKAAVIKVCRESRFFPSVAQVAAAAEELDPGQEKLPTAAEAWEEVSRLMRNAGGGQTPTYSCDLVKRAVRSIGFGQLCMSENPETDRAHFLRIYDSMRSRRRDQIENEKVLAIAGVGDTIRALAEKMGRR